MINESEFNKIFGNETVKKILAGFSEHDTFPHALIFSGPRGSGKKLLADFSAGLLSCTGIKKPCGTCRACTKINAGICPDVIYIGPENNKKTLGIDVIRQIGETAATVPNDLNVKIYIISDADCLTVQAQNAFLKLFEEPPANVYFFLLCSSSVGLLPTVRSRATELRTEQFPDSTLSELLQTHCKQAAVLRKNDADAFERILRMSGGSYGEAVALIEKNGGKLRSTSDSAEKLFELLSSGNRAEFLSAVGSLASSRDCMTENIRVMMLAVRDMIAVKHSSDSRVPLLFFVSYERAVTFSDKFSIRSLSKMYSVLEEADIKLNDSNVNLMTAALVLADDLRSAQK